MSAMSEDLVNERAETLKKLMDLMLKYIDSTKDGVERAALCETLAKLISYSFDNDQHAQIAEALKDLTRHMPRGVNGVDPLSEL